VMKLSPWVSQEHKGNHYTLIIQANGKELLRELRQGGTPAGRRSVDLTPWAGKDVLLTIWIENSSLFEWAKLIEPVIEAE